ncbi:hypothetical protein [Hansschlegelia zhihuaiae]|uniref:Uncharacterized protein n=1 Tax=Hansschlegelia zhihuaiae TaxID=405005 RepID=A0A4Q0MQN9_9HYPH|nr:hypothetical protein [Hansschlegelia zhihuaiae]RXF75446.1 hypothetical protein EK403_00890 [Hansschlegelia zhihuaiae]
MPQLAHLVRVDIREGKFGMFSATSPNEPDLFVSAKGYEGIHAAVGAALEHIFSERLGLKVRAVPSTWEQRELEDEPEIDAPWSVVPVDILAAHASNNCI